MKKCYVVRLSEEERIHLNALVHTGRVAAAKRRHAQILLLVDQGVHGPGYSDREAAEPLGVTRQMIERVRERCVLEGLENALTRRPRSRNDRSYSMVRRKLNSLQWSVASRLRGERGGHCIYCAMS